VSGQQEFKDPEKRSQQKKKEEFFSFEVGNSGASKKGREPKTAVPAGRKRKRGKGKEILGGELKRKNRVERSPP